MNGQWYPLSDNLVTELRLRLAAADFEKVTRTMPATPCSTSAMRTNSTAPSVG